MTTKKEAKQAAKKAAKGDKKVVGENEAAAGP